MVRRDAPFVAPEEDDVRPVEVADPRRAEPFVQSARRGATRQGHEEPPALGNRQRGNGQEIGGRGGHQGRRIRIRPDVHDWINRIIGRRAAEPDQALEVMRSGALFTRMRSSYQS